MAFYEHVFIARPDITAAQVEALIKDYVKIVTDGGGKVAAEEYWGLKSLAYRIKKNRKAHYVFFGLDAPHAAVAELERKERLDDNVLRFLTVCVEALEQGPSVMVRARSSDEFEKLDKDEGEGK
ncbi:MAG TPA: 30S ribosomal protein S6 [Sphingomonadales bacterium]|nr:30S ribosomal protein S6 [Sphingomonadales bacterium]